MAAVLQLAELAFLPREDAPAAAAEARVTPADDRSLVRRARAGDKRAFRELVQRYQRKVYGIAYGMLHNNDDALDVAQEAFIKVHRYLDRFKGTSSFYTWLYRIVINLCIDHLRKVGKQQAVDYDDSRAHDGDADPAALQPTILGMDPQKALQRREIREKVEKALETLSANHRAVLLMREVEGMSYSEMAEAMQCSKGTIMSRLFHARRRMQGALLELMDGEVPLGAGLTARSLSDDDGADAADEGDESGGDESESESDESEKRSKRGKAKQAAMGSD
ncbi:MAG: sigma-70 family RNA polymerase sigma factor [Myxococcales bacterium]|nr:sigma-70 family RNA polymerase sigma factor [Myxococcales bacterium]